jgi:putative transposase
MDGSIRLSVSDRKCLLALFRSGRTGFRYAHVVLLVAEGASVREVRRVAFASFDLINIALARFRVGGVSALTDGANTAEPAPAWVTRVAAWVSGSTPEDFGYFRTRWSCETLAEVLAWEAGVRKSAETIRRGLRRIGFVWRRPRPVVGPRDPDHARKVRELRRFLAALPAEEAAVFQDEVDIHLNPKIGSAWMRRGEQAEVRTPGNNEKRHLAGSLVWRTGTLIVSPPARRRNAELFVAHLDELRRRLRRYHKVHVVCDNAAFHRSRQVLDYLARWGHRVVLHFLPRYAPQTNPIERVWWRLHEELTRNHRCKTIDELLDNVYDWVTAGRSFYDKDLANYATAA